MIEEQPAGSGNLLPDLAWVETLFAALAGGHSANDDTAATSESEQASLIDTVVADDAVAVNVTNELESEVMSTAATSSLALPAQCLLRDAVEMKAAMLEQAAADTMAVDIGTVERVDAAFVQILVSLVKQRQAQGKELPAWQGSSAALNEAAQVLGLTDLMKFPAA